MRKLSLDQMKNVDIRTVDPAELVDVRGIRVKDGQPKEERVRDFVRQVGNPYCYRVGKIAVKVSFTEGGATLEDRLKCLLTKT